MDFSSDYTQIWTADAEPGASDDVGSSRTIPDTPSGQATGPLTGAIEGTQWTAEDIQLATELLQGALLVVTLYYIAIDGGGV